MGISCSVNSFPFFLSLLMVLTSRKIYLIALHPLKLPYNKAKAEREKDKIKKSFLKIPESISVKKVKFHSPLKVTKRKLNQRKITKIIMTISSFFYSLGYILIFHPTIVNTTMYLTKNFWYRNTWWPAGAELHKWDLWSTKYQRSFPIFWWFLLPFLVSCYTRS